MPYFKLQKVLWTQSLLFFQLEQLKHLLPQLQVCFSYFFHSFNRSLQHLLKIQNQRTNFPKKGHFQLSTQEEKLHKRFQIYQTNQKTNSRATLLLSTTLCAFYLNTIKDQGRARWKGKHSSKKQMLKAAQHLQQQENSKHEKAHRTMKLVLCDPQPKIKVWDNTLKKKISMPPHFKK